MTSMPTIKGLLLYLMCIVSLINLDDIVSGVSGDGMIYTEKAIPAVTQEMLSEIRTRQLRGESLPSTIEYLRQKTVPPGYSPHTWETGKWDQFPKSVYHTAVWLPT